MKKVITNYRYWLLLIVACVATLGLFAVPVDELPLLTWAWVLFSTKAVGIGGYYLLHVLIRHWEARNAIPEYTQFTKEF